MYWGPPKTTGHKNHKFTNISSLYMKISRICQFTAHSKTQSVPCLITKRIKLTPAITRGGFPAFFLVANGNLFGSQTLISSCSHPKWSYVIVCPNSRCYRNHILMLHTPAIYAKVTWNLSERVRLCVCVPRLLLIVPAFDRLTTLNRRDILSYTMLNFKCMV